MWCGRATTSFAAVGDQPDAQAAANRLLRNQEDIGKAIAGIYGDAAGNQLTRC
jgi:hypothetical protein